MKILSILIFSLINLFSNELNFTTYKSDFIQTITNESNATITYTGEIFIKEPHYVLWKYKTPIEKNIYILKNDVIIDEPHLEQMILSQISNELNLFDMLKKSEKIAANTYTNTANNILYTIKLKDSIIKKIQYEDEIDNDVNIIFSNSHKNIEINNSIFEFTPPEYYDIIRK